MAAFAAAFAVWYGIGCLLLGVIKVEDKTVIDSYIFGVLIYCFSIQNSILYFFSKWFSKKFGLEIFFDIGPKKLSKCQKSESKPLEERFFPIIRYYKIAGPYMLMVIIPLSFINTWLFALIGTIYLFKCIRSDDNPNYDSKFDWGKAHLTGNRFCNTAFPLPGDNSFDWGKAHIRGTPEAAVTGHAFCHNTTCDDSWRKH
jgi:hypothetical protein